MKKLVFSLLMVSLVIAMQAATAFGICEWPNDSTVPVELSSFTAAISSYGLVQLQWVTQSETNVQGYQIYRNEEINLASALRLNAFIQGTNTSSMQRYVFEDEEILAEGNYYYWLQHIEFDGTSEFHGPVMATVTGESGGSAPSIPMIPGINMAYPNPFNPSITIVYGVPERGDTHVAIYNMKGQLVKRITDRFLESGSYQYFWNGRDESGSEVSSGVYMVRMTSPSVKSSRKIVLAK
ncbi:MAG: T9SS type A sorting domain-containing protein [Candidatus Cloacimonetes bacterium]|nr:T9SS type A sorting domain-containing protein [Candidatus Cloacimonadota bacterium]